MINRIVKKRVNDALARQAAVGLIGPRQVGKTTLAFQIASEQPSLYLDLEAKADRNKLIEPVLFLRDYENTLVILDEIHKLPEIFQSLRGIIDKGRREGYRTGRFLILGSASIELLRQSSESLAGRIEFIELTPFCIFEIEDPLNHLNQLWLRGGYPDSYLAATESDSFYLRQSFIRTYLERDVPQFGPRIPAELLERLWIMLAHNQGGLLNASQLAAGLSISAPTVTSYISLLVDLLLIRRLPPYFINVGKRLVKSPKTYVRDTGLLHSLLGIRDMKELVSHPVVGYSWEGFVIENLIAATQNNAKASFYRTAAGAEADLLLDMGGNTGLWVIEIKRGLTARPSRGFYEAIKDLKPTKAFLVHSGEDQFPIGDGIQAIGLYELTQLVLEKNSI